MKMRTRLLIRLIVLVILVLGFVAVAFPRLFSWLTSWLVPYQAFAHLTTCDTLGRPCTVEVGVKYVGSLNSTISQPMVQVLADSPGGRARLASDKIWGGGKILCVRAIPGGIDVFHSTDLRGGMKQAIRFLIEGDHVAQMPDPTMGTPRKMPGWLGGAAPAALHDALGAVDGVAWRMEVDRFDSVALIQAVNTLQALGQKEAVAALRTYLPPKKYSHWDWRDERDFEGVHLILRLLFVPREGSGPIPPLRKGFDTDIPQDVLGNYPDFPLVTVRGVPFLLSPGEGRYTRDPEDPREHLDDCLEHAAFRSGPIIPDADPIEAARELVESPIWRALRRSDQSEKVGTLTSLRLQVLFALGRVVQSTGDDEWRLRGLSTKIEKPGSADQFWEERTSVLRAESPVWDPVRQDFIPARYAKAR